ncbi:MAG: ISAs1 family transposase [Chloroflexota bacterium]|nr:ISAs1 family transposase [Chloroflexota bacterium]
MDEQEYNSLAAALADVPDPRQARGKRHAWSLILVLIGAALVSGQRNVRAIGQWVAERHEELATLLHPPRGRLPSTPTFRRALRAVDIDALERRIAASTSPGPAPTSPRWAGQAMDGKAVRGANTHGAQVHLVSLVRHHDGVVLGQVRVADKSNEITASPRLLAGRDLRGTVTTMDALLTQRGLAAQIRRQGGHYLMAVKENQPALYTAIHRLFSEPVIPLASDCAATSTCTEKGHGRLETRTLERSAALNDYLDWPDVGQVLRRTYRAVDLSTGAVHQEVTYGLTSLPPQEASVEEVALLWREHWTIENRVHYPRDVSLGEDAGQVRVGNAPQALAALRNGVLNLLRGQGWASIADALRHFGAYAARALRLLGALPARL